MTIKMLPEHIINQIAAGEVIEKPSSIVKELIENAIDAGASKIKVITKSGGKSFLQVIDNGKGMSADDLKMSIKRHATSKLPNNNLQNVNTMGFRGEALSSIANVSRMTIASKDKKSKHGWLASVSTDNSVEIEPISMQNGTIVTVKELFYVVPARLKFLKPAAIEIKFIMELFNKIAMSYPDIQFTLENNEKTIYDYLVSKVPLSNSIETKDPSLDAENINKKESKNEIYLGRIQQILGAEFIKNCTKISYGTDELKIYGFTSLPTFNGPTSISQYFYINNRYIKNKTISYAIRTAYSDYLPKDRHCLIVLFLDCDNLIFDINVSPDKTQVRFVDEKSIKAQLTKILRTTLAKVGNRVNSSLNTKLVEKLTNDRRISNIQDFTNNISIPSNTPLSAATQLKPATLMHSNSSAQPIIDFIEPSISNNNANANVLHDNTTEELQYDSHYNNEFLNIEKNPKISKLDNITPKLPLGKAVAQVKDTYVISENDDGIVIIDQHAVHERIVYEQLKKDFLKDGIKKQSLVVPISVTLNPLEMQLLENHNDSLKKLGLWLEKFDDNSIMVRALPSYLIKSNVTNLIKDLFAELQTFDSDFILEEKINHILATFACHHSIRAGKIMNHQEMNELLRQIEKSETAAQCNHGRPTYVKISKKDLDKMFHRC